MQHFFSAQRKESFTCRQDEKEPDVQFSEHGINRDNSLLEADEYGQPLTEKMERKIKPFGEQGDIVDYVFEHAESYACNEAMPNDTATLTSSVPSDEQDRAKYRGINSRIEHVYEAEDEIQLYFRPKRGKRRSRKGEF